jgi:deazaflavin-dependent oxidoreductase (nitroreductase family)
MRRYQRLASSLSRHPAFAGVGRWVVTPLDRMMRGSRLAPGRIAMGDALCHVTTTGRRSGEARTTPLLFVTAEGGGIVVVATNWGTGRHPAWSHNIEASPAVSYEVGGVRVAATARRPSDAEYDGYWGRFVQMWPNYQAYRDRVDRDTRMYVLDP